MKNKSLYNYIYKKNLIKNINYNTNKTVWYGIMYISTLNVKTLDSLNEYEIKNIVKLVNIINNAIDRITFKDFINLFPIEKFYKGKKYQSKDYYSTLDYLSTININDIILNHYDELMSSYSNTYIINYMVKCFLIIDRIRKLQNKKSLIESFLKSKGIQPIKKTQNKSNRNSFKIIYNYYDKNID